jgi:hypothetical protein
VTEFLKRLPRIFRPWIRGIDDVDLYPLPSFLRRAPEEFSLFVRFVPRGPAAAEPLIDSLTRRMTAVWRMSEEEDDPGDGSHCICGADISARRKTVGPRQIDALCIHFLAYHRHEIPAEEIEKVMQLPESEVEPSAQELAPPDPVKTAERAARKAAQDALKERRSKAIRLLYVRPKGRSAAEPLIDALTRRMTAAWRASEQNEPFYRWAGFHICVCGACSSPYDHDVLGLMTNSLCVHYLALHRDEVPAHDIAMVMELPDDECEPNDVELKGKVVMRGRIRIWPRD